MRCDFNASADFWAITLNFAKYLYYLYIINYVVNSSNQASSELCTYCT